jgi:hypothetical protein
MHMTSGVGVAVSASGPVPKARIHHLVVGRRDYMHLPGAHRTPPATRRHLPGMAAEHRFSWTLPGKYEDALERDHPSDDAGVHELTESETVKLIDWLTNTSVVARDGEIEDSDDIRKMLDIDGVGCVGTRFAGSPRVSSHNKAKLTTLAYGDWALLDPAYKCAETDARDAATRWASMMPRGANFRPNPEWLESVQVVALRMLFAMVYDRAHSTTDRSGVFDTDERHFIAKWRWLMNLPWMENVYAQDILAGASEEYHRVERRRPLVEAAGLLYVHAGLKYIFDPDLFGFSCMFTFHYKAQEHSMLAYMAMYASLIWFGHDVHGHREDTNLERTVNFSLSDAMRAMRVYLGDTPLPNPFSLALLATPSSRAFWRDRLIPWSRNNIPRLVRGPYTAEDRDAAQYLQYWAKRTALARKLDLEELRDYAAQLEETEARGLELDLCEYADYWKDPVTPSIMRLNEMYPGVPDLLLYILCMHFRDLYVGPTRVHLATRIDPGALSRVEGHLGYPLLPRSSQMVLKWRQEAKAARQAAARRRGQGNGPD